MKDYLKNKYQYISELTVVGHQAFLDGLRILLYKENEGIYNILDFENNLIYSDPLFFALFSSKDKIDIEKWQCHLNALLFGYGSQLFREKRGIEVRSDEAGRIYIPTIGWLGTQQKEQVFAICQKENRLFLYKGDTLEPYNLEPVFVQNGIEILHHSHTLLQHVFPKDCMNNIVFKGVLYRNKKHVLHTLNIFNDNVESIYALIKLVSNKFILFDSDPNIMDSFMSVGAYGAAFLNAFQKDYDEVFFLEDISHQVGHLIFEAMTYKTATFYKIDPGTYIENIWECKDTRSLRILLHAIFTYVVITDCLGTCLESKVFSNFRKQQETEGRLVFTLVKFKHDLDLLREAPLADILTEEGMKICNLMSETYEKAALKHQNSLQTIRVSKQPYNFTYSIFIEENAISLNV